MALPGDTNNDGVLSAEEYWARFDKLEGGACSPIPQEEIDKILKELENNG